MGGTLTVPLTTLTSKTSHFWGTVGAQCTCLLPFLQASGRMIPIPRLLVLHLLQFSWLQLNLIIVTSPAAANLCHWERCSSKGNCPHSISSYLEGQDVAPDLCYTSTLWQFYFSTRPISGSFHGSPSANPPHHEHCCLLQAQPKHFSLHNSQFGWFYR